MYNHEPTDYECAYCSLLAGTETQFNAKSDIFLETDKAIAFISPKWWVNNPGNAIIIPREHVENIYDISDDLLVEVNLVAKKAALAMRRSYGCDGISFRQHNEPAGGQHIWHFHLHLYPRWENDGLYENDAKWRYVSVAERLPYAKKLKDILGSP